jgi:tetratricopeptide (TPR) repeat protein
VLRDINLKNSKNYFLFFIITILSSFTLLAQSNSTSNELGIAALNKKDYGNAKKYFLQTLKKSPNDAFANYNLACVYALLLNQCELDATEEQIIQLLEKAIRSKPQYKDKMLKDKDLAIIKGKYSFNALAGFSKKEILTKVIWYGPSPGAYGPLDQIIFYENGTFTYSIKKFSDSGEILQEEISGKYNWEKEENLFIQFNKSASIQNLKSKKLNVKISNGVLEIEGFDHSFLDEPDRCSA